MTRKGLLGYHELIPIRITDSFKVKIYLSMSTGIKKEKYLGLTTKLNADLAGLSLPLQPLNHSQFYMGMIRKFKNSQFSNWLTVMIWM